MRYAFQNGGKATLPAQLKELRKIAKISRAIIRHEVAFTHKMQSLLRYSQEFEEHYGVRFVGVAMMDIVETTMS